MKRLVVVSDYAYPSGGTEHFVYELLARARGEFACSLLTWPGSAPVPDGVETVSANDFGDIRESWSALAAADVLLVVTSFNVRMLARLATAFIQGTSKAAVTVVQTSGPSDPSSSAIAVQRSWLTELLESSVGVVAVSDAVRDALDQLGATPIVIENAARLTATPIRLRGRCRVGFIGRPLPQKGWLLFVRLAETLRSQGFEFIANTVTMPPPEAVPVESHWLLDDEELRTFFLECDVLVAPYLYADGLPLALLEALNCGTPIIGVDTPAIAPLLRRHGQVVVPATFDALRDALIAWRDGRLVTSSPRPGAVPGWDATIDRYLTMLRAAADRPSPGEEFVDSLSHELRTL